MNRIVLIGFMGAGKTTVGKLLAQATGNSHYDFDELIVAEIGMSISEYFALHGDEAFREVESKVLGTADQLSGILSTGGGIVMRQKNRELLKQRKNVVYLKTDIDELLHRVQGDAVNVRPLVENQTKEEIKHLFLSRVAFYEESAQIIVETTGKTPEEIVVEIIQKVGG